MTVKQKCETEFYNKLQDKVIYNQIKSFVETEINPYCNKPNIMDIFKDFKNFSFDQSTVAKNLKTSVYYKHFVPSKYGTDGIGADIRFSIVEDINTKEIIDSYFNLYIHGYNYEKISGKSKISMDTEITNSQLKQMFHLSTMTKNDKIKMYIDQIDINILRSVAKKT